MKRTILIVEDEPSIAELQRDYLEMNGYQTEIAVNGEQGLELSLSGKFELIVLDVMLPKLNGFEVCKRIRGELDIPILMVTARREDIDIVRGLGLGADDYMTKPFKPAELVARVKAHLSRYDRLKGRGSSTSELEIRGLRLNPDSRRAFVRDEEVSLTTKEFDLLYFLALHPNHVFSKDQLFERLWGVDSLGDTQTVTVHIRKLREKIEEDSANPLYIETLWGAGYRFRS
ncbi:MULTISPECIES: response regulator transcription factor [Paenibacillus]|uniref:DNA-binding response regulator n=1 Tax=Paenibacillus helianthi TaxID=1349432 RepID=A0ABX3EQT8_9BACL|nr:MULTISPECIES: response regulator transcription factor [Paenibacillus]OKP87747.1 DNA-binding response regulator [Paenibacillus helianthi]OKP92534.1 DNA-binding response regulator [Paenibacillus sp. P3E]OKP93411.1 DNA-binding response regulator [Paenibacillus sp. P32E]OKP95325.1 DNA-binding response regulator [Paenibacillus sp. P46E]